MRSLHIYIDTSVVGGCFDEEYSIESTALFDMAKSGEVVLVISDLMLEELDRAPQRVQQILAALPTSSYRIVKSSSETEILRDTYLTDGVVGYASRNDAHHVAIATVERVDMIVGWNFKHIVHFDKIRGFNAVNMREGYQMIEIRTPKEVV